jgi:hypothetical protein
MPLRAATALAFFNKPGSMATVMLRLAAIHAKYVSDGREVNFA